MVYAVYTERRPPFAGESGRLAAELREQLGISALEGLRIVRRYFIEGIDRATLETALHTVFSEPQTDIVSDTLTVSPGERCLAVEMLPGQFDQRADSCEQCIQLITQGDRPRVRTAMLYILRGAITPGDMYKINRYIINPVECREAFLETPSVLSENVGTPSGTAVIEGFRELDRGGLRGFIGRYSLAMDEGDAYFCQSYFREAERRDPTLTEIRLIDTYWSDHCRHTTFLTQIDSITIADSYINETFTEYLQNRCRLGHRSRPLTLMDAATFAAKELKAAGRLGGLDESEEINACSIKIKAVIDGEEQDWLLMFKNETHNHPTEIEPFGGAATCLGGAIRDPLSGRAYVYGAMRVTGAADPRTPLEETLPGKLPQSRITQGAAAGYSSYGNQIGIATGGVYEYYHPGYAAKRLETGAVIGAVRAEDVVRGCPQPGDYVILLGGRTGRDGCGGATGSSKTHTADSLAECGAEVQKGNAPEERKIQRLFRNPAASRMIVRCNDFGAGGVSVAIGELADGLEIDLSKIPKKYEGLSCTELAISESQERMAVVVAPENAGLFGELAAAENLEATHVATVTSGNRLIMRCEGETIVDLSRTFLNSNGAPKNTSAEIEQVPADRLSGMLGTGGRDYAAGRGSAAGRDSAAGLGETLRSLLSDLNICSKRGLGERFDSSVGAATVSAPYGGLYQLTPTQYMAAKLPLISGETDTASFMTHGFDPYLSEISPFHGSQYAVVESVARIVAAGGNYRDCYLSFQEYFGRPGNDPRRWGKPLAALLGAYRAQIGLGVAAIGGKDSMSGSFEDLDVPPTLISFAVAAGKAHSAVTPEFKKSGNSVYLIRPNRTADGSPDYGSLSVNFDFIHKLTVQGVAESIWAIGCGGVLEGVAKMCFGNKIGFKFDDSFTDNLQSLLGKDYGGFIIEINSGVVAKIKGELLGRTTDSGMIELGGESVPLDELIECWEAPLEGIFPTKPQKSSSESPPVINFTERRSAAPKTEKFASPRALVCAFPGTNSEYDTARAFDLAGAESRIFVLRNLTAAMLEESIAELARIIGQSQIFVLPGGFSGGDEPDGSGKFITAVLRSPRVREALGGLINDRGGLVLGICNGFQALLKSGLLPYGGITDKMTPGCATLTHNTIGRHVSRIAYTRVASVASPWMSLCNPGEVYAVPVSHGEGRFYASDELITKLIESGQIATQYCNPAGEPTMDPDYNPNGSLYAIEGIFAAGGRIFGKMGHNERCLGDHLYNNITGNLNMRIFEAGVGYFKV